MDEVRISGLGRRGTVGAGVAMAVLVAGISATGIATAAQGGAASTATSEIPATATVDPRGDLSTSRVALASDRALSRRLIRAGDLGSGWAALPVGELIDSHRSSIESVLAGAVVSPAGCAEGWQLPAGYRSHAVRVFQKDGSTFGPYAGQLLASFESTRSAKTAIADARARVAECRNLEVSTKWGTVKVNIRADKGRRGADFGYKIGANLGGLMNATGWVSVKRKGVLVSVVGVGSVGSTPSFIRSTTARAVARAGSRL